MSDQENDIDSSGSRVTNNPYSAPVEVSAEDAGEQRATRRRHGVIGMILGASVGGMLLGDISILEAAPGTVQTFQQAQRSTIIFGLLLTTGLLGGAAAGRAIAVLSFDASASRDGRS